MFDATKCGNYIFSRHYQPVSIGSISISRAQKSIFFVATGECSRCSAYNDTEKVLQNCQTMHTHSVQFSFSPCHSPQFVICMEYLRFITECLRRPPSQFTMTTSNHRFSHDFSSPELSEHYLFELSVANNCTFSIVNVSDEMAHKNTSGRRWNEFIRGKSHLSPFYAHVAHEMPTKNECELRH